MAEDSQTKDSHTKAANLHSMAANLHSIQSSRDPADWHKEMAGYHWRRVNDNRPKWIKFIAGVEDEKPPDLSLINASPTPRWANWPAKSPILAPESPANANVALRNGQSVASEPANAAITNSKPLAEYIAKRAEKLANETADEENDVANGDGGAGAGPSGPSSGPSVPASGPSGPGRIASLSASPMLGGYAEGVQRKTKHEEAKEELKNSLVEVANKYYGYLPNFKNHFTKKEVDAASRQLPPARVGMLKNGTKKKVAILGGVSKGKEVEFVYNERRDFGKNKNGAMTAEWVPPQMVDPATPKDK